MTPVRQKTALALLPRDFEVFVRLSLVLFSSGGFYGGTSGCGLVSRPFTPPSLHSLMLLVPMELTDGAHKHAAHVSLVVSH